MGFLEMTFQSSNNIPLFPELNSKNIPGLSSTSKLNIKINGIWNQILENR